MPGATVVPLGTSNEYGERWRSKTFRPYTTSVGSRGGRVSRPGLTVPCQREDGSVLNNNHKMPPERWL